MYINARRDRYSTVKCMQFSSRQEGMEKADDDDDLANTWLSIIIKWPLFAADTPKKLTRKQ